MKLKPIFVAQFILLAVLPCQSALGQVPSENPGITLQKGITIEGSANEGEELTLSLPDDAIAGGSGNSENYSYRWEYRPSDRSQLLNPNLQLSDPNTRTLTVRIPTDFIARDYNQSDVIFTVTVGEDGSTASTESIVTIIKRNNFVPTLDVNLKLNSNISGTTASITAVVDNISDSDGDGEFTYSWQSLALGDTQWRGVKMETTTRTLSAYTVPEGTTPTTRYRVEISYTDAQGHAVTEQFGTYRTDVDIDDDGLIEIYYLEDLDAIRYQVNGSGYQPVPSDDIDLNNSGCNEDGDGTCNGYEIARHLDFGNDAHYQDLSNKATWTEGAGWSPIDSLATALEGNGNTISGLRIVRNQGNQGLFAQLGGSSGIIRNLGLLKVNINIMSSGIAGGFAGRLGGRIIRNSYVKGTIVGNQEIGGFAGDGLGQIINSYANVNIEGRFSGGLYGEGDAGITSSYVTGSVTGPSVGAIVSESNSFIANSYAANNLGNIKDNNQTGISNSYARVPDRHNELKEPTAPGTSDPELYIGWRTNRWDFGTSEQFPILKYVEDCSNDPQTQRTDPPQCGTFLPDQNDGLRDLEIISEVIKLDKVFASEITNYDVSFNDDTPNLTLRLKAYESDSQISVRRHGDSTDYFAGMRDTPDVGNDISLTGTEQTTVTITVREVFPATETEYVLTLINETLIVSGEIGITGDVMITENVISTTEGRSFTLEAPQVSGGIDMPDYEWTVTPENTSQLLNPNLQLSDTTTRTLTVTIPNDFIGRASTSSNVRFKLTVNNDVSGSSRNIVVRIDKTNNDSSELNPTWVEDGISLDAVIDIEDIEDLDGNPGENDISYQWQRKAINNDVWMNIPDDATSETYTIPQLEYPIAFNYRVGVRYTDRQGYLSDIAYSDPTPADYRPDIDTDDDGLIEVYYLEDLDAIRYQLDGSGYRTSTQATVIKAGCGYNDNGSMVCRGYELIRDLDFGVDNSYSSTANRVIWQPNDGKSNEGWMPIGSNSQTTVSAPMIFEGNGYTISNLYQNTATDSGLFGNIENVRERPLAIYNIGLLDIDIQTRGGDNGGLAAACRNCRIANSYVTGTLSSEGTVDTLGGLVGRATSDSAGATEYRNIYARVDLTGNAVHSGHLLGLATVRIAESYARGYRQETYEGAIVGSLSIRNDNEFGFLVNSYATGSDITDIIIENTLLFMDSTATQTVSALTSPTTNEGIYEQWNQGENIWDFGTSEQYPILRYNIGNNFRRVYDYDLCSQGLRMKSTDQPQCGTFLPDQGIGLRDLNILEPTITRTDNIFVSDRTEYTLWIRENEAQIQLELNGYDFRGIITIDGVGAAIGTTMTTIALPNDISVRNIVVADAASTEYKLTIIKSADIAGTGVITVDPMPAEDGTWDEGSRIELTSDIVGGSYLWTQPEESALEIVEQNDAMITVRAPGDFVAPDAMTRNTTLTLTVSDPLEQDGRVISRVLTINKIDNGPAEIDFVGQFGNRQLTVIVGNDPDGDVAEYRYRWQSQAPGSNLWATVASITTALNKVDYQIPADTTTATRYRVEVQYTDAQGYSTDEVAGNYLYRAGDNDDNDNGFIDIYTLEDLAATTSDGRYELRGNLDFNDPLSYADTRNMDDWSANEDRSNRGWEPIPPVNLEFVGYIFNGNGHTISNLYINRAVNRNSENQRIALFREIGPSSTIRNIGLINVDIRGYFFAGGLVGISDGSVISSYVGGSVKISSNDRAAGLVGENTNTGIIDNSYVIATSGTIVGLGNTGGLVGFNSGTIRNSGANVAVQGTDGVGGLIGRNRAVGDTARTSRVHNSFAQGSVTGNQNVGGLIGLIQPMSTVQNSYASGDVTGSSNLGGLIGSSTVPALSIENNYTISKVIPNGDGRIGGLLGNTGSPAASYWNSDVYTEDDRRPTDDDATSKTTVELQSPIDATDIYRQWSTDNWDFGDEMTYPMLRYDPTSCNLDSDTARCGLLPNQQYETGLGALFLLSNGEVLNPDLRLGNQPFSVLRENYSIGILNRSEVQLRPFAVGGDAEIKIISDGDNQDYFSGKSSGQPSNPIPLSLDIATTVSVVVTDGDINTTYTLAMSRYDIETESTVVDEGDEITLNTGAIGDSRNWSFMPPDSVDILSGQGTPTLRVRIPDTFVPGGMETTMATLVFEVDIVDGATTYTPRETLIVNKINNGMPPDIGLEIGSTTLSIVLGEGTDSDGEGEFMYTWEKVSVENGRKERNEVSTSPEYRLPDTDNGSTRYFVNVIHIDGQGFVTDYATREPSISEPIRRIDIDIDDDDNGLIDIYYLDDLDEIREHLTEMPATCGQNNDQPCEGYELQRSLNFRSGGSYIGDVNQAWISTFTSSPPGWQPIGSIETPFNTVFTAATDNLFIDRLYINRQEEDNIGLFGVIGPRAQILDIQVRNPNIRGRYAVGGLVGVTSRLTDSEGSVTESSLIANSSVVFTQLTGTQLRATRAWLGGLVGSNYGSIVNSYTQVRLNGDFAVGGLAGYSFGPISDSYALSFYSIPATSGINEGNDIIEAGNAVGGLVGYNHNESPFKGGGSITNSYAINSVLGDFDVGGLVGYNDAGTITNSYALGHVVGGTNVGGLVGYNSNGTIVGYAGNIVTGGNNVGDLVSLESGGTVTALLTTPTLTYTRNFDGNGYSSCAVADGQTDYRVKLPACDTPLPEQDSRIGRGTPALSGVTLSVGTLEPEFDPARSAFSSFNGYEIFDIPEGTTKITVTATTNSPNTDLVFAAGSSTTRENNSRTISRTIPLDIEEAFISAERGTASDYAIVMPDQPDLSGTPRMPCRADTADRDGDGLIEICDLEGLYAMRYRLDADAMPKTCGESNDSACIGYELVRDLDFNENESYRNASENKPIWTTGRGWRPIGNPNNPFNVEFSATTGHSIANLMINRDFIRNYSGLFGYTGRNARIVNIELSDANVRGRYLTGGLVGRNEGTIINSRVTSASTVIVRNAWGGGLVGDNAGIINDSYTDGDVTGRDQIGGLAGINSGQIINSVAKSNVAGATFAGGLVGVNAGNINNSYASGTAGENFYYAGGLVGLNVGSIADTYSIGNVNGRERVGGLVGDNRNLIASSYAAVGNVVGTRLVGGLVGINSGSIIDSYGDQSTYGLVGENFPVGTIRNSQILSDMNFQSQFSIPGWRATSWDFGTNRQYPALKYLRSETDPIDCEQCGMLLQGQAMRPDFSLSAPAESETLIETPSGYTLNINFNARQATLIPDADVDNVVIRYRVDNGVDQTATNRQPFTVALPSSARTITITLDLGGDEDFQVGEMIEYRVDVRRVIYTQIRLFPEGLLNP